MNIFSEVIFLKTIAKIDTFWYCYHAVLYLQLKALENRKLFLSSKLIGPYGIMWNDKLDIEVETIYEDGETVRRETPIIYQTFSQAVASAQIYAWISQKQLAELTGIDQLSLSIKMT